MASGNIFGLIKNNTLDNGKIIKFMEKELCLGLMDKNILDSLLMMLNKEKEHYNLEMEKNLLENGIVIQILYKDFMLMKMEILLNNEKFEKTRILKRKYNFKLILYRKYLIIKLQNLFY